MKEREAIEKLVRVALDGDVELTTCRRLIEVVAGNPLFLREVLDHSIETGTLHLQDGCWVLDGPLSISPTLSSLGMLRNTPRPATADGPTG